LTPQFSAPTYVTAAVPGTGGRIKERPEDFVVEEIPAYEACGDGEHLYLFVEKRSLTTTDLVRVVARRFRVAPGAVGFAGLKDKHAVTRQLLSVHLPGPGGAAAALAGGPPSLDHDRATVIWADRHTNKLRRGHLRGNRFRIKVRGAGVTPVQRALRALRSLAETGAPNRAGEQRFGARGSNHRIGRADIAGDYAGALAELLGPQPGFESAPDAESRRLFAAGDLRGALEALPGAARVERVALRALLAGATPERAFLAIDDTQRRFWITAFQSAVFNDVVDRRVEDGLFAALVDGDLAQKHDNGAVFAVDAGVVADPATRERLARLEISPSGPLWGARMTRASGAVDALEVEALRRAGASVEDLERYAERTRQALTGARRPLRVPVENVGVEAGADAHGEYILCAFDLPAGAFATVVMDEVMKPAPGLEGAEGAEGAEEGEA
jgi:tRNA pseudouridine13 synthase